MPARDWADDAACNEMPSVAFYGSTEIPLTRKELRLARGICASCPVQRSCMIASLRGRERYGVWGGIDEKTRRRLLRAYKDWRAVIDYIDAVNAERTRSA